MRRARETTRPSRVTRRAFLGGFGASLLSVPFFSGFAHRALMAAEGMEPARFVMVFTGNQHMAEHWLPPSLDGGYTLASALEPLQPFRDRMTLVHGLTGVSGHSGGMSETTTGRPSTTGDGVATGGPSIDQYLASLWSENTPLPSLELGVSPGNNPNDQICYSAQGLPLPAVGNPLGAFDTIFGVTNEDPSVATARRRGEASVLDVFAKELTGAQSRLSRPARVLLDEHLTLVRAREQELARPYEPLSCELPSPPSSSKLISQVWSSQNENLSVALGCGTVRVASLRAGGWGGMSGYSDVGFSSGHHNVAHGGTSDPVQDMLDISRWHAAQVADLAARLDAQVLEDGSTMLDHTVLVWFSELGLGGVNNHNRRDVPVVLVGGSRAGVRVGEYLDFGGENYQHFLYTLARGLGEPDLARFGDAGEVFLDRVFV